MKLLRWAVAGASVYAVYRYSIGSKAKGEDVFVSPDKEIGKLTQDEPAEEAEAPKKPAARKKQAAPKKAAASKKAAAPATQRQRTKKPAEDKS